ncbi:hypothetical protein ACF08M_35275 [Streptomyces sp. NPDC015032]|uniref:hypothetical protein n=1 Tax=Streptomyces sp. NPDC015032 TaxID=3364937 RepID=UPI0036FD5989
MQLIGTSAFYTAKQKPLPGKHRQLRHSGHDSLGLGEEQGRCLLLFTLHGQRPPHPLPSGGLVVLALLRQLLLRLLALFLFPLSLARRVPLLQFTLECGLLLVVPDLCDTHRLPLLGRRPTATQTASPWRGRVTTLRSSAAPKADRHPPPRAS